MGVASTSDHKNIKSPFRSGIEIEDYKQLNTDEMDLCKTIEACGVAL
jgi:hypothetical protein